MPCRWMKRRCVAMRTPMTSGRMQTWSAKNRYSVWTETSSPPRSTRSIQGPTTGTDFTESVPTAVAK